MESLGFSLSGVAAQIAHCIERQEIGEKPINKLISGGNFCPKEGWLWDYKGGFEDNEVALAKRVKQVVSFHNSFGGYIIYGVHELVKDKVFAPVEIDVDSFNLAQLRDKIKYFTGSDIDCTFGKVERDFDGKSYEFGLLLIPRRSAGEDLVKVIRDGPSKAGKSAKVFSSEDVLMRSLDQCVKAEKPEDYKFLFSPRNFVNRAGGLSDQQVRLLEHNLPDKQLICPKFVGRQEEITLLWQWMAEPFDYTRVLAGDGGKGKTSIAYKFCEEFSRSSPQGFEKVIWLSAKEKQFSGAANSYYDLSEADFSTAYDFLISLAGHCALLEEDVDGLSVNGLKSIIKQSIDLFPSLVIVDNIDALEEDEQKKIVDCCRHLASERVRYLITTRKKFSYSSDSCIDVAGMNIVEYKEYVESLIEKYSVKNIKNNTVEKMHEISDGSPLLTQSIIRLHKSGLPLDKAISEWKGELGEDARNAAVRREIDSLSPEAKRSLLAITYFGSCSFTELKQVLAYPRTKLMDVVEELKALFLVDEPRIVLGEDRFTVSSTTSLLVGGISKEMAGDYQALLKEVRRQRSSDNEGKRGNKHRVGMAISQARALKREGDFSRAFKTIDNELARQKQHPDLILTKGWLYLEATLPDYDEARKNFRLAHTKGATKKEFLYDCWYRAEEGKTYPQGMIDVARHALGSGVCDEQTWNYRLARGLIYKSKHRKGEDKIKDLIEASEKLSSGLTSLDQLTRKVRLNEIFELNNYICKLLPSAEGERLSSFDIVSKLIDRGDVRTVLFDFGYRLLSDERPNIRKPSQASAYNIRIGKHNSLLKQKVKKSSGMEIFESYVLEEV
ncbi:hypothetical protein KG088_08005 [Halomonas sp. TRM85114]|uniref:hypothetical protein n=1 Tax=Halomonas jincaotanensis TaxID=2810616 RepID=UPI001BD4476A|nr:hypothetical protein [Halomonas jincaotanensis]MBS9403570.1 hypothetical protein [Halomonas jincaotanensis]